jgi:hypothetical protein
VRRCYENGTRFWRATDAFGDMFPAFNYGLMYVLSSATIITAVATALASVLGLVMIVGRSVWRCFAKASMWERTEALAGQMGRAYSFGCLAQTNKTLA